MDRTRTYSILAALLLLTIVAVFFINTPDKPLLDSCAHNITTCTQDADCGESGPYGERFCKDGDVWQPYYAQTCTGEPGTCRSECIGEQTQQLVETCADGCRLGTCT